MKTTVAILVIFFASLAGANNDPAKESSPGGRAGLHGKFCTAHQSPLLQSQNPLNALLGTNSVGYDPWVKQNTGLIFGYYVVAVQAVDSNVVWAGVGMNNQSKFAVHSTNAGATWIRDTVDTAPLLFCTSGIYALDASRAWVLMHDHTLISGGYASGGGIFRTTDGGVTWNKDTTAFKPENGFADFIHFFDADNGVCVGDPTDGYFEIYTTSNAGETWSRVPQGNIPENLTDESPMVGTFTAAGTSLWFPTSGGSPGRIYKTNDKGASWSTVVFPGVPEGDFPAIGFQDESVGLGCGTVGEVMKTTDAGVTWAMVSTPSDLSFYWIKYVPNTAGMYVGTAVHSNDAALVQPEWTGTWYTTDGGANWTMAHTWYGLEQTVMNYDFDFFNRAIGWSTGEGNSIYEWKLPAGRYAGVHPDSLAFVNHEVGVATEIITVDFVNHGTDVLTLSSIVSPGSNFTVVQQPALPAVIQSLGSVKIGIRFTPHEEGVIRDSLVFISDASNAPALPLYLDGKGVLVHPAEAGVMYATSTSLHTLNTTTGAPTTIGSMEGVRVSSLAIRPTNQELYGASTTAGSTTLFRICSATGGCLSKTTFPVDSMYAVTFDRNDTLYGATVSGKLYRLGLDTGDTTFIGSTSGVPYASLAISPGGTMYASVSRTSTGMDRIYKVDKHTGVATLLGNTGDNGITPSIAFGPTGVLYGLKGARINSLITIDTLTGAAASSVSTGISGITAIAVRNAVTSVRNQPEIHVPSSFVLEQNFPNPFNPSATIRYGLPKAAHVTLKVYNMLGQEVATLVNGVEESGYKSVEWNASGVASGVYFYRLQAGDPSTSSGSRPPSEVGGARGFMQTRKLVLLR